MLAYLRCARRRDRARPAVRRPRLPLGPRLLRMGNRVVRPAGTPLAPERLTDLPRADVAVAARPRPAAVRRRGASCRCSSSTPRGRLRARGRPSGSRRSCRSRSPRVLAPRPRRRRPIVVARLRRHPGARRARLAQRNRLPRAAGRPECAAGGLCTSCPSALGRPLIGVFASAWYPFPAWFRASASFRREFGMQSLVWARIASAARRCGCRLAPRGGRRLRGRLGRDGRAGSRGPRLLGPLARTARVLAPRRARRRRVRTTRRTIVRMDN